MPLYLKRLLPHLLVTIGFVIISLLYFSPILQGKQIFQSDIMQYIGMAKQQNDFRAETGQETYWTNSAFGGMPTYQLGAKYPNNFIKKLDLTIRFLPRPADYLFLYLIGFYVLLLVLKIDFKLAAIGALAFGFSTYLIIILGVGHNSKAHAIAYMPLVLSGILLTFQRKYIIGFLLTIIALGLEIVANHFQMTYYLLLLVIVLGITFFIDAFKKQTLLDFFRSLGVLTVAAVLAVGLNATSILATQEYAKESTRGKSELSINPDGSEKEITSGLERDYITQYSYGFLETFNLFIPRLMGGGNGENVGKNSETYEAFRKLGATPSQALQESKRAPMYWGDQPIVEAPAYVGAVVLFLFIIGLFLVKERLKWWLVGGTILSLLLSYGKNLGVLTDFFIDYMPLYNKFRAVTSIQVLLELCIPVMGIMGLSKLFDKSDNHTDKYKALKYATFITGGLALLFLAFKSSFDFAGINDGFYRQNYGQDFVDALKIDRKAIFTEDTIRSLVLVLLSAGVIYLFLKEKLKRHWAIIAFGVLIVFDLVVVDKRYVNNEDFTSALSVNKPFTANSADLEILKDTTHFRVLDITSSGSRASYFHNSLSGYHAASLKKYDELFDFYIVNNNLNILNMLNTKYIIIKDDNGALVPYLNDEAHGNAWFVSNLKAFNSANEEMLALGSLDTKMEATVREGIKIKQRYENQYQQDSLASIALIQYKPNYLKYESSNNNKGFAVFSEIYYDNGWQAYIDGNQAEFSNVNYVLRGMEIPKGRHIIEFKFEPQVVKTGSKITLATSVLVAILIILGLFYQIKLKRDDSA
jgi:hypothetical protein